MNNQPPGFFLRFFRWFCHPRLQKPIEGDLMELYDERVKTDGKKKADRRFIRDVLQLFRKDIIKPADGTYRINNYGMIKHNFILALRSFKRFKTSFLINLLGLTSGLASVFLIYLWINDELAMDRFHANSDRLYQVMQNVNHTGKVETIRYTPAGLAEALAEEFPEVEMAVSALEAGSYGSDGIVEFEEKKFKALEKHAGQHFFEVFSYKLLNGDAREVLKAKNSAVISEELAGKLFDANENPIGQTVSWSKGEERSYVITGIFEDLPSSQSERFDLILTEEDFLDQHPHIRDWRNSDPDTYVVLDEQANIEELNSKLKHFGATKVEGYRHTLFLQKYADRYLYGKYENGEPVAGRMQYVRLFSIIAVLVLVIACINFMNLSTARASRRLKEIGVKKAMGAGRRSLAYQFLTESFLLTLFAMLIAIGTVIAILPEFNQLTGKTLQLNIDSTLIGSSLIILVVTSLLAGSYPAIYLSGFNPTGIFRGKIKGTIGDLWARKGLVVFQFAISILLISSVMVISAQIDFIQKKNLGFEKEHVIYFNADGNLGAQAMTFIDELKNESGVVNAALFGHDLLGGMGKTTGLSWEGKDPEERIRFGNLEVGYDLIETFGMELVEGRTFSRDYGDERSKIIFNETAIKAMGLEDPIGKTIILWGREREIIGVSKDFHFESLHEEIKPCFFQFYPELSSIVVRIQAGTELQTIERIEEIYRSYNEGLNFNFSFFNQEYKALYHSERQVAGLAKSFSAIAIIISCLGLFGLVTFTAEQRKKEIGVRKVLGSGEFNLMMLLSFDFMKMVGIAIIISLPVAYFSMQFWLASFAYRIDLEWWYFIASGILSLIVAWVIMSVQTMKAARANPVESLKYE